MNTRRIIHPFSRKENYELRKAFVIYIQWMRTLSDVHIHMMPFFVRLLLIHRFPLHLLSRFLWPIYFHITQKKLGFLRFYGNCKYGKIFYSISRLAISYTSTYKYINNSRNEINIFYIIAFWKSFLFSPVFYVILNLSERVLRLSVNWRLYMYTTYKKSTRMGNLVYIFLYIYIVWLWRSFEKI